MTHPDPAARPPLGVTIIPVTPLQQNCSLLWCTATMKGAVIDPGGDLPRIEAAAQQHGVTIDRIWLTHGHIDHAGGAAALARAHGVPIEGPHEADRFWLARLADDGRAYGIAAEAVEPDRWLDDGDTVSVGDLTLGVSLTPGHTPGHVVFAHAPSRLALVGDVLFQGSVGRTDFPLSDPDALVRSVVEKLWPMGDDMVFIPGHGPPGQFGQERRTNPFVGDRALGGASR